MAKKSGLVLVKNMERTPCPDCDAEIGDFHSSGCDVERCPKCKGQLISCDCFMKGDDFNERAFQKAKPLVWTGIMYEEEHLYCEKHNLYCYFDGRKGWVNCNKNHPKASHDLNNAVVEVKKKHKSK